MDTAEVLEHLPVQGWRGPFVPELRQRAVRALEEGRVLVLAQLPFQTEPDEAAFLNADAVLANFETAARFSRKVWGLLCLELWHQIFHDRAADYRRMLTEPAAAQTMLAAAAAQ